MHNRLNGKAYSERGVNMGSNPIYALKRQKITDQVLSIGLVDRIKCPLG